MAFHTPDKDDQIIAEINMTPLIDIMLVLLIIFMVTSSISLESGLDINLPKVSSTNKGEDAKAVIVSLDKDGRISVQGKRVEFEKLSETIANALKAEGTDMVILEGDQKSKLGSAVEIMDLAKAAGASRFAIAADSN